MQLCEVGIIDSIFSLVLVLAMFDDLADSE